MNSAPGDGIGLAIFVKTPGYSEVKTRLAASLGAEAATEFHSLSAAAVAAVVGAASEALPLSTPSRKFDDVCGLGLRGEIKKRGGVDAGTSSTTSDDEIARNPRPPEGLRQQASSYLRDGVLKPYWAVAETEALNDPTWNDLPCLPQGIGDLGRRMRTVCDTLLATHGRALLLGADAPQIQVADLRAATAALGTHDHVLGPAADGGFWLFGTRIHVPDAAWDSTPWSRPHTAEQFLARLERPVARLRALRDVDTTDDLQPLFTALKNLMTPLPEQESLGRWLREHCE